MKTSYFADCTDSELNEFVPQLRQQSLKAGEHLFNQAAQESVWYLVRSGRIEIQRQSRPAFPHTLAELEAGEAFGEMSMLERSHNGFRCGGCGHRVALFGWQPLSRTS